MEQPSLKLLKDRTGGERIADAFTFIRLHLGLLLQTHFLLSLPLILLTAGAFVLLFPGDFSLLETLDNGPFIDTKAQRDSNFQNFIFMLFVLAATAPVTSNTLIVLDQFARSNGKKVEFAAVWSSFKRNILKLYVAKLIMGTIMVVSGIFLVLPALVFYTLFTCVEMLILQHGFGVFRAISRSSGIMSRSFWTPLGVHLGLLLIVAGGNLGLLLMVPMMEWLASLVLEEARDGSVWMVLGRSIGAFNSLLGYLFFMLPAAGAGIQFFTLREEIARTDIMQRVRDIGTKEGSTLLHSIPDEQY